MTDNSILNMVGGEKHINPHYDIKEESANKGFTGIEVNGVRFSNIQEMLVYMDKQRNEIILLEKENAELREKVKWYSEQVCFKECAEVWGKSKELLKKLSSSYEYVIQHKEYADREVLTEVKQFLKEVGE